MTPADVVIGLGFLLLSCGLTQWLDVRRHWSARERQWRAEMRKGARS